MAIEITEELRQAVHEDDCEHLGHIFNLNMIFGALPGETGPISTGAAVITGPNDTTFPHLKCSRCGHVWLVIPESGKTYDDAAQNLKSKLTDPESIQPAKRKTKEIK
jgi:hypothetical protein